MEVPAVYIESGRILVWDGDLSDDVFGLFSVVLVLVQCCPVGAGPL